MEKRNKPTDGQIKALRNFRISEAVISQMTFQDASEALDKLIKNVRAREGKAVADTPSTAGRDTRPIPPPAVSHAVPSQGRMEGKVGVLTDAKPDEILSKESPDQAVQRRLKEARMILKAEMPGFEDYSDYMEVLAETLHQIGAEEMQRRITLLELRKLKAYGKM